MSGYLEGNTLAFDQSARHLGFANAAVEQVLINFLPRQTRLLAGFTSHFICYWHRGILEITLQKLNLGRRLQIFEASMTPVCSFTGFVDGFRLLSRI